MKKLLIAIAVIVSLLSGCASVPMESKELTDMAKKFNPPADGHAGLYIFRPDGFGGALKKDVWIDGKCIGETAPYVFFYEEVQGDMEHNIATESEFSPNNLLIKTESGKNYFIRQYIKIGLFVGGAGLKLVGEEKGKKIVTELQMAKKGKCSQQTKDRKKAKPGQ